MTPTSAFATRLATDDHFRNLVLENPKAALAEYGIPDEPGLVPDTVELPSGPELATIGVAAKPPQPKPQPKPPPSPDVPVSAQLFDPS